MYMYSHNPKNYGIKVWGIFKVHSIHRVSLLASLSTLPQPLRGVPDEEELQKIRNRWAAKFSKPVRSAPFVIVEHGPIQSVD